MPDPIKRRSTPAHEHSDTVVDIAKRANAANKNALEDAKGRLAGVIKIVKRFGPNEATADPGKTTALSEDPWSSISAEGKIVEAPFDLLTLAMLPEHSSELGQCIQAMAANIDLLGHRQISRIKLDDATVEVPSDIRTAVTVERAWLTNFFEYCTFESFSEFRERLRIDLEATGNAYFEVIRDAKGQIQQFQHIPSYQMRLTRLDDEPVEYARSILKMMPDGQIVLDSVQEWRRFRRYVQGRTLARRSGGQSIGSGRRWFKSFGDSRDINRDTGDVATSAAPVPVDKRASEVVHIALHCARSPYGVPRFIGNLLSIYGDRAAEEINYTTFRNNNIPSMMVLVSGGQLTEGSIKRLESFVESQIQGSDNYSKFVIVEAESTSEDGEDSGQMKLQIERMSKDQHNDALFQQYSKNNQDKIRRAFRLPPLLVGRADDYTRATAEASRKVADEQVFSPERDKFDALFNRIIYPVMGVRFHKFKSNTPNTTDNESLVKILSGSEKTGGMTPRIARVLLADILSSDMPDFPPDFPADVPFSLTMAEAVKNMADPTEPGQQVTALKILKALLGDAAPDSLPDGEDAVVSFLKSLNSKLEDEWQSELLSNRGPGPEVNP